MNFLLISSFMVLSGLSAKPALALGVSEADLDVRKSLGSFLGVVNPSTNLPEVDGKAHQTGEVKDQPWSGTYWPLYMGSVARPYSKDALGALRGFTANERRGKKRLAELQSYAGELDKNEIDDLSPTEKYDLYLGDREFTLTHAIWNSLDQHASREIKVQGWEGSCHGWASAALYDPRPREIVNILSLDGKYLIPFYPDDLKALDTLLWANSLIQDHSVVSGLRCQAKEPKVDPSSGKVLDVTCEGVNPGVFHLAVQNMVGLKQTGFIINRVHTTQVWNQPISKYKIKYYNRDNERSGSLQDSIIELSRFKDDPFAQYRPPAAKYIVGVEMVLSYLHESNPSHQKRDSEDDDHVKKMRLNYDIELDSHYQVVGGEWISYANDDDTTRTADDLTYPGFIWKFEFDEPEAISIADVGAPDIQSRDFTPAKLLPLSKKAASFLYNHYRFDAAGKPILDYREQRPQPLGVVVHGLMKMAHGR